MFELFGAFMALYGFDFLALVGWGACRWLMHDEMLGSFMLLLGCPGCLGCPGGTCRSPFLRSKGVGGSDS